MSSLLAVSPSSSDLLDAATECRKSQGLSVLDLTAVEPAALASPTPPDYEDFSDLHIVRKL